MQIQIMWSFFIKRWYGPDGKAERDRDYNHTGNMPFPHEVTGGGNGKVMAFQ